MHNAIHDINMQGLDGTYFHYPMLQNNIGEQLTGSGDLEQPTQGIEGEEDYFGMMDVDDSSATKYNNGDNVDEQSSPSRLDQSKIERFQSILRLWLFIMYRSRN